MPRFEVTSSTSQENSLAPVFRHVDATLEAAQETARRQREQVAPDKEWELVPSSGQPQNFAWITSDGDRVAIVRWADSTDA